MSETTQVEPVERKEGDFSVSLEPYQDNYIRNELHPLLDKTDKKFKEEDECESNQIVIVEYRGKRYRVDFSKEGEELQLLPRQLKKVVALEDIQDFVEQEELDQYQYQQKKRDLAKLNSRRYNQVMQRERRDSVVDRMREKLKVMNPLKYKDVETRSSA